MKSFIPESIKAARERVGMTQKEVEQALSLRALMIRDYEMGRLKLPASMAIRLAALYKTSLEELLGQAKISQNVQQSRILINFKTLFLGSGFSMMFLDPVLRGFMEDHHQQLLDSSIFDLITAKSSDSQKSKFVFEVCQALFALASSDHKITSEEMDCIRGILEAFQLNSRYKTLTKISFNLNQLEFKSALFEKLEARHFVMWLLFFFSYSDGKITEEEKRYLEFLAERLKINRSNFLAIQEKFIKEKL